ncbi:hypothetical protein O181_112406, partial [Austropuccinia psidii MF-1]|nr:hypothetical protein [Austropuccinia psidii MF-1]
VLTLMWEIQRLQLQALGQSQIFPSLQFPPIPLIHKLMCIRAQKAHLKSDQTLIPNQNFHVSSSLIPVGIQSQPTIPLDEKLTGRHHPYASKPRTAHASSSREKMVDDEDENMSPNQMDQMMNQGGTISWCMSMALSQIVSSPILKCPFPRGCLNNPRIKAFSSLPAPPSTEEHEIAIEVAGHLGYVPKDVFNEPSTLGLGEVMATSVQ